ncbi:MAG: F420-0--gamma-glutamyl ligase, partial [Eubacteriales bacterium]|nr:F420-0--gamma-glutamyl ligase [Eubacteriales bacterium]
LQLVIDQVGLPRMLLAAFLSAVTKPFGVKGVFYRVCGQGVGGIDGFYTRSSFPIYHDLALLNPPNPDKLCEELCGKTGIPVVLMDANDLQRDQLGKCNAFPLTDAEVQDALRDNPSGQGDELTPLILIRPV